MKVSHFDGGFELEWSANEQERVLNYIVAQIEGFLEKSAVLPKLRKRHEMVCSNRAIVKAVVDGFLEHQAIYPSPDSDVTVTFPDDVDARYSDNCLIRVSFYGAVPGTTLTRSWYSFTIEYNHLYKCLGFNYMDDMACSGSGWLIAEAK